MRVARDAVAHDPDGGLAAQCFECKDIKTVCRGHPHSRSYATSKKERPPGANTGALFIQCEARELAALIERNEQRALSRVHHVRAAMHADRPAFDHPRPHSVPKRLIAFTDHKCRIVVVRNDGHDRLYRMPIEHTLDRGPLRMTHRVARVIQTDEVAGAHLMTLN